MIWAQFEQQAQELAKLGRERFERTRVALIATLRKDGSPRISPIEPVIISGHLVLGAMRSAKVGDLRRDPRCTLHSAVSDINGSDGEFKLYGRALPADAALVSSDKGWWTSFPPDKATLFDFDIETAAFIGWDIQTGEMRILRWSRSQGLTEDQRPYP